MVCAVESGKGSWQEVADWFGAEGSESKRRVRFTSLFLHLAFLTLVLVGCTLARSWTGSMKRA
jgi:hypothetical protein